MTSSVSSATPTGASGQDKRITAVLAEQGGRPVFKLRFQGETVALLDSGALNRWAANGIVDRHKIALTEDGVSIDARLINYNDPHATEELERILNRPPAPAPPAHAARDHAGSAAAQALLTPDTDFAAALAESLRVTRDGFEFHVAFRTRFGETKTEKLEEALETLQKMRIFRSHVSMQKSGIRLVVTRWDGETFVEEPGIENVEHATPEEVEELIRANLHGGTGVVSSTPGHAAAGRAKRPIARVQLVKKPHEARFHLVLHRQEGKPEEGPMLIRPNMAKLAAERIFRPDVTLSMTAMNDRIVVERGQIAEDGQLVKIAETLPLVSEADGKRLEELLNQCLRGPEEVIEASPAPAPVVAPAVAKEPAAAAVLPAQAVMHETGQPAPAVAPEKPEPAPAVENRRSAPLPAPAAREPAANQSQRMSAPGAWMLELLRSTAELSSDEINCQLFEALHIRFNCPVINNEHDCPAFVLEGTSAEGPGAELELVLTPHYLLGNYPFGYIRFGPETRLFLKRLDDYILFPHAALRGAVQTPSGAVLFVTSDEFSQFLQTHSERSYKMHFASVQTGIGQLSAEHDLIWPLTREERLFKSTAVMAASYGLPVENDAIVLDPTAPEFIGFKRTAPRGMELRDGEDFIRFTPEGVELSDGDQRCRFSGAGVLLGWALDQDGRVCALYRKGSGFIPPAETKLLRFLSEDERERAGSELSLLAELPGEPPASQPW